MISYMTVSATSGVNIHSFIHCKHIIEILLWARYCARFWRYIAKRETDEVCALEVKCSPLITWIGTNPIFSLASVIYPYSPAVFLTEWKQTSAGILVISIILSCTLAYHRSFNMAETKTNGPQNVLFVSQLATCTCRSVWGMHFMSLNIFCQAKYFVSELLW